ncbi:MAG TPA: hypothetical protein VM120_27580 [Bryobacteraceae bacterium]|nr:hypothetical protein [Bryobacteraceae bacterium]
MKNCVVGLMGRVLDGGVDVLTLKEGVVSKNLIVARAIGQKFKNVGDTNTLAANAGTAPTFAFFDGDSFESVCAHIEVPTILKDTL